MMRKYWPFNPYIHQRIYYQNGQPNRIASTIILFVKTPSGRLSKCKFHWATCYERIVDGRISIPAQDLTNKAIDYATRSAPKLPRGYSYTQPCIY